MKLFSYAASGYSGKMLGLVGGEMARDLLDLHGFRGEDVEVAIDRFFVQLSGSRLKRARIMTGKGTGKVKAIAIRYIQLAGYHWAYEKLPNGKDNEGCLVLFLE